MPALGLWLFCSLSPNHGSFSVKFWIQARDVRRTSVRSSSRILNPPPSGGGASVPGYFALVMATGIVSIAAFQLGMAAIAWGLFWINLAAYVILWLLTLARLLFHASKVFRDLASYNRGPGFLTTVAATCIVGIQALLMAKSPVGGLVFWLVGLAL